MTVETGEDGAVALVGVCASEDADLLLQRLIADRGAVVDWRRCESMHTAVLQVLVASKAELLGPPTGPFLIDMLEPVLKRR
jgi:hypothetical protein